MEGIHLTQMLLQEDDWMVKLDLKDAYFAVPIHLADRKYLTFQFRSTIYQFECLPFGLSSAPRVFPCQVWKLYMLSYTFLLILSILFVRHHNLQYMYLGFWDSMKFTHYKKIIDQSYIVTKSFLQTGYN